MSPTISLRVSVTKARRGSLDPPLWHLPKISHGKLFELPPNLSLFHTAALQKHFKMKLQFRPSMGPGRPIISQLSQSTRRNFILSRSLAAENSNDGTSTSPRFTMRPSKQYKIMLVLINLTHFQPAHEPPVKHRKQPTMPSNPYAARRRMLLDRTRLNSRKLARE